MTDQSREIIGPERLRYATWPGGRQRCVIATLPDGREPMWLVREDGRYDGLARYRVGMLDGKERRL